EYDPEQLPGIALRGLLASALALVIAWVLAPVWGFLKNFLPERWSAPQPQISAPTPSSAEPPPRAPALVLAPHMPQVLDGTEVTTLRQREAQRRREKARLQLELAYVQALPAIGAWFPRKMFDDFVARHLGDHLPPEDVEDNARQLQSVLRQQQEQTLPP